MNLRLIFKTTAMSFLTALLIFPFVTVSLAEEEAGGAQTEPAAQPAPEAQPPSLEAPPSAQETQPPAQEAQPQASEAQPSEAEAQPQEQEPQKTPFNITLGIRTGITSHDIVDNFQASAPNVNPILDLNYGNWSLGFSFLWVELEDTTTLGIELPPEVAQLIGQSTLGVSATGSDTRMDFDASLKYSLNRYITPFVGYRHERFANTEITFETLGGVPQEIVDQVLNDFKENIDIDFAAFGASLQYPFPDIGLIPYFVGTAFPYGVIEGADDIFVGYALEGGVALLLDEYINLPIYITATGKYQEVSIDEEVDIFNEIAPGAAALLPAEEKILHGFFGVFYRFSI